MRICIWWLGFVRSGCNAATAAGEKLKYENLDVFLQSMRGMYNSVGPDSKMWKADIDSAFRHVPLLCVAPPFASSLLHACAWQANPIAASASRARARRVQTQRQRDRGEASQLDVWSCFECLPLGACWYGRLYVRSVGYCLVVCVCAGELLKAIARRLFHLPVCRFVDDFFAAEHEEVADHGMKIFAK